MKSTSSAIIMLSLFCLCIICVSCNSVNSTVDANIVNSTGNQLYSFKTVNDHNYLSINSKDIDDDAKNELADLSFDSFEQFIDTVVNQKLEDWQLKVIETAFDADENGVKICDFSNLFIPVVPDRLKCTEVTWSGEQYAFLYEGEHNETAVIEICTAEFFNNQLDTEFHNFFDKKTITLTDTNEYDQKTEYYYSTSKGDLKKIRYSFVADDRSYTVDETYRLRFDDPNIDVSDTVPYKTVLYITDKVNHSYAVITLFDSSETDYSLFGIVPYEQNK